MVLVGVFKGILMLAVSIVYTIIMLTSAKMLEGLQKKIAESRKRLSWNSLFSYSDSSLASSSFSAFQRSFSTEETVSTGKVSRDVTHLHSNKPGSVDCIGSGQPQIDVQRKRARSGTITMRVSESMLSISQQSPS